MMDKTVTVKNTKDPQYMDIPEDIHSIKQPDNLTMQDNPAYSVHYMNTQDNSSYSVPCDIQVILKCKTILHILQQLV